MRRSGLWYRIAIVLNIANFVALGAALNAAEVPHALAHVAVGVGLGIWLARLRRRRGRDDSSLAQLVEDQAAQLDEARAILADQAAQLSELQERVDFAERVLAQSRERQERISRDNPGDQR